MTRIGPILVWSVIAAAFIGPGTVTVAASAGSQFGLALLWAILFSGIATFTLQEFAARLSLATRRDLGAALRRRYPVGLARVFVIGLVGGAILLGCAAYEAGNILGGAAGVLLALEVPRAAMGGAIGALAIILLYAGTPVRIAQFMAVLVAIMGVAFAVLAIRIGNTPSAFAQGLAPRADQFGSGEAMLGVLALVGTTVVPYNLFLGSALARGQGVGEMRIGLAVSIVAGVAITAAIMVVGASLPGEFSFEALAQAVEAEIGPLGRIGLAAGLFAAGLSSAVTAPLAAALTARGLFDRRGDKAWRADGGKYRMIWGGVVAIGVVFSITDIRPVPAIVAAQAFNGILLPVAAYFLLAATSDRRIPARLRNNAAANGAGVVVLAIVTLIGTSALFRAFTAATGLATPDARIVAAGGAVLGLVLGLTAIRPNRRRLAV